MKAFTLAAFGTVVVTGCAALRGGSAAFGTLILLAILEITLSFDNAVLNALYLQRLNAFWQRMFLTVGILIAVFGMRLLFPLVVVALSAHTSLKNALDLALHHPQKYADVLRGAHDAIATFGAVFLGMIFLDFLTQEREVTWLGPVERFMVKVGKLDIAAVMIMLGVMAVVLTHTLFAGVLALIVYLAVGMVSTFFENREEAEAEWQDMPGIKSMSMNGGPQVPVLSAKIAPIAKAGFGVFLYLELMDASFSFDGVMAAFAITSNIILIALGLGVGALWIRSMTVYLVRRGVLKDLVHLEHGAHYAIGALAVVLFTGLYVDVPEFVTAGVSLAAIGASVATSVRHNRAATPS